MLRLAHIVNPLVVQNPESDLRYAQPLTLHTMIEAKHQADATDELAVELFAAAYPEDAGAVPDHFTRTQPLERSILDIVPDADKPRKLPLLVDILDRVYEQATTADYIIYSNIDIGLWPSFYLDVAKFIEMGNDALVIARRTLSTEFTRVEDLEDILLQEGKPHFGFSCFVFPRSHYPKYLLGDTCLGLQPVGVTLAMNMIQHAQQYQYYGQERLTFHLGDDRLWHDSILDSQHVHNEKTLDWVVNQLLRNGPLPERGASLIANYEKWRCNYVITKLPRSLRRDCYRALRKFGLYSWVARQYASCR